MNLPRGGEHAGVLTFSLPMLTHSDSEASKRCWMAAERRIVVSEWLAAAFWGGLKNKVAEISEII